MNFGQLLKGIRQSCGISLRSLSVKLEIDRAYLSRIEAEKVRPSDGLIIKLANGLNYDRDELFLLAGRVPKSLLKEVYEHPNKIKRLKMALSDRVAEEVPPYGRTLLSSDKLAIEDGFPSKTISKPQNKHYAKLISEVFVGSRRFAFLQGNCLSVLKQLPDESVECVITSPPYWKLREYNVNNEHHDSIIGNEDYPKDYVNSLVSVFNEVKRILKADGSLWLNIGDKFHNKNLMGMPWRVALTMQDEGWILRNDIIWDQMKGTQSAKDRMRDVYEHIFHFVKSRKYFFDANAIRIKPQKIAVIVDDKAISATGVSGKKYREQIQCSPYLDEAEKKNALKALDDVIMMMRNSEIVDFRMTIRGHQRTFHSESTKISGRAKELEEKGYFFILMRSHGFLPSDIWRIVPEDKWRKDSHCAVFPEELLFTPIKATSRTGGIVLDPFSGTGSTVAAALKLGRKGIGIDLSDNYLEVSEKRIISTLNGGSQLLF